MPGVEYRGGGGVSWHFNFAFQIDRGISHVNSGLSANFSHAGGTHCGLWRGVIHSTRGPREISHSEIDLAGNPPCTCLLLDVRGPVASFPLLDGCLLLGVRWSMMFSFGIGPYIWVVRPPSGERLFAVAHHRPHRRLLPAAALRDLGPEQVPAPHRLDGWQGGCCGGCGLGPESGIRGPGRGGGWRPPPPKDVLVET